MNTGSEERAAPEREKLDGEPYYEVEIEHMRGFGIWTGAVYRVGPSGEREQRVHTVGPTTSRDNVIRLAERFARFDRDDPPSPDIVRLDLD